MGQTFDDLYREFSKDWDAYYGSDPERDAARLEALGCTVFRMLEMLRDTFDPK